MSVRDVARDITAAEALLDPVLNFLSRFSPRTVRVFLGGRQIFQWKNVGATGASGASGRTTL
jgi:hypothetical protein